MGTTIARLFDTSAGAAHAVIELGRAGVPDSDISVISLSANDQRKDGNVLEPHYGQKASANTVVEILVDALTSAGASKEEADAYAEGVHRGGTLVSAKVAESNLLSAQAAINVEPHMEVSRGAAVQQSVWTSCAGDDGRPQDEEGPLREEDVEEERRMPPVTPTG
jgi:hypothetical protein